MPFVVLAIFCALLGLLCGSARGQTGSASTAPAYDASAYVQPGQQQRPTEVSRPWARSASTASTAASAPPLHRGDLQPTTVTTQARPDVHTAPPQTAGVSNAGRELTPASYQRPRTPPASEVVPAAAVEPDTAERSARTVVQPAAYKAAARPQDEPPTAAKPATVSARSLSPANNDPTQRREGVPPPLDPARSLTTIGGGLAVVIGLFLVAAWWWRKRMPQAIMPLPGGVLEVLGRSNLGNKHRLHLVRLGNKLLLISTTADCAETLAEIDDPDEVTRIIGLCLQSRPGSSSRAFRDVLAELAQDGGSGRRESRAMPDELASLQAALRRAREANLG